MNKLNLAIIGQGRSGRQIHGDFFLSDLNEFWNVKYIVDMNEIQRVKAKEAFPNATILSSYEELFDKKDISLVVNASYSKDHYILTKNLLLHGLNVLCEKPFCHDEIEAQELIDIANKNNLTLAVFYQSLFSPFYLHAKEVCEKGLLGDIKQINIHYSGFSRRWDWQSLQKMMGGNSYNTGPHPYGLAFGFLDFDEQTKLIFSKLDKTEMTMGDYDDYVKVLLTAPNKPVIDIEINNNDAYSPFFIKILGSRGCYKTNIFSYEMKYLVPGENPIREPVDTTLVDENDNPCYCRENLIKHEESGDYKGLPTDVGCQNVYRNLYHHIVDGEPLILPPEKAIMVTRLINKIHQDNPIEKKFF